MATPVAAHGAAPRTRAHVDPATGLVDGAPIQTRSERPWSFDPADFPTPSGFEVNWKHTPVAKLGALLSGDAPHGDGVEYGSAALSAVSERGYLVDSEGFDAPVRGEFFRPEDLASALAWTHSRNALHVRIPQGAEVAETITLDISGQGAERSAYAHIIVEAQPNSKATVLLRHTGSARYTQNVEIIAREGSDLTVVSVQQWEEDAIHLAAHQARVDKDATLTHFVVSFGGAIVRVNPSLELAGTGAEGAMFGLAFADAGQHLESQVYLHHKGEHTTGDVLYKAALQGATARNVWIGDVLIGPDATGTDSYEKNQNLVLTDGARADSIPNLEIQTGDIRGAGHASATGRFDDEQLFYLQARGISEDEARRLVVFGFLGEIVQRLGIPALEGELLEAIETELARTQA